MHTNSLRAWSVLVTLSWCRCTGALSRRRPRRARVWTYPVAPRGATVDDYHGVKVADPYRALEDLDAPATRAWVSAEAHLTQSYLEAIPQRQQLRSATDAAVSTSSAPACRSPRVVATSIPTTAASRTRACLLSAAPLAGPPAVALDPNLLPGATTTRSSSATWPVTMPSCWRTGCRCPGSDWTDWHIRDLDHRAGSSGCAALHQVLPAGFQRR